MMTLQQQVRRDTIKTVNFRGKLIDAEQGVVVHHDVKADTIGSYIDEFNHKQFVVVSNGDTFAVQMYVPRHIDTQQLKADIEVLRLMERIEAIKPCDTSALAQSASNGLKIAYKPIEHKPVVAEQSLDVDAINAVFVLIMPLCTLLAVKSLLAWGEMLGKLRSVWSA